MRLRYATPDDAEAVAAYHHRCVLTAFGPIVEGDVHALDPLGRVADFREWFGDGGPFTCAVAEIDGIPVGHVLADVGEREIAHLFVDPDHHGKGLGRTLLRVGERFLSNAGALDVFLVTIVGNAPALGMYSSAGWTLTDELVTTDTGPLHYDEHVLRKQLEPATHVSANREHWDDDAHRWEERGRAAWRAEPSWGEVGTPDTELGLLTDIEGLDVVELGCGTGYVSAWCLEAGAASAVGIDNSPAQLATAARLQREFDRAFPLVWTDAEQLPLRDGALDLAISEYGAAIWCDPDRWIPEAARVLKPGGRLIFLGSSALLSLCYGEFEHDPTNTTLQRPQRNMRRFVWPDADCVEFHVSHGDMIKTLRRSGFVVDDLIELYAPVDEDRADTHFDRSWSKNWPAEEIWIAHLPTGP